MDHAPEPLTWRFTSADLVRANRRRSAGTTLHRVRSDLLLRQSSANLDEAERQLRAVLDVARSRGARMLELRAATALATALSDARRRTEANEVLRPACATIIEGRDIADLVTARKLLEVLDRVSAPDHSAKSARFHI